MPQFASGFLYGFGVTIGTLVGVYVVLLVYCLLKPLATKKG